MKKSALILLTVAVALLCGCTGYREINRGYLTTALGFSIDDGDFTITLETISSSDVTDKPSEVITLSGRGKSLDDAYTALEKQLVKPLYFEQLGTIVISNALDDAQIKLAIDFYKKLPSANYGIYLVKTNDISALFNSETAGGVLGYDVIGIIKNFEKRNSVKLSNRLYEINRIGFLKGVANVPVVNVADGKLELSLANGGQYE